MTRRLVVLEDSEGTFHALDPKQATGVGLPAFRYGVNRPATGSVVGEAFINQTTGIASVWDGTNWTDIAKPVVVNYPDDATLLADAPPANTVGLSVASGNLFSYTGGQWRPMGVRTYPTMAGLTADTPQDGTVGYAVDTGDFAVRAGNAWAALAHQGVNVGTTAPTNPVQADMWLDISTATDPVLKFFDGTNWAPTGAQVSSGTRPANPSPGDIYFNLNRAGRLEMYVNGAWEQVVTTTYHRGTLANRPDWNSSDYGDFYEDSGTGTLYFAGKNRWIALNGGGLERDKINANAPDKNFRSSIFNPPDNKLSVYEGTIWRDQGDHAIQLAIRKSDQSLTNQHDFELMRLITTTYNPPSSRVDVGYHTGGQGFWDLTYGKAMRWPAHIRLTINRLAAGKDHFYSEITFRAVSNKNKTSIWEAWIDKANWDYLYFSGFNGQDYHLNMRQIF